MRPSFAALAALPLLSLARLEHGHHHVQGEVQAHAVKTEDVVVTETVYTTLIVYPSLREATTFPHSTTIDLSSQVASSPRSPTASSSGIPSKGPSKSLSNPYAALIPQPDKAIIVNSCDYPVYVSSIGDESCGSGTACELIPANSTYTEPIRSCYKSGISLKLAKNRELIKPMQFEYTVWDDRKTVSYDISYLDCMMEHDGNKDFSQCVGHERGIQAAAGENCPAYHCIAEVECAQQAYTVPEFGYLPGAPVGACNVKKGIAFELCAENRR